MNLSIRICMLLIVMLCSSVQAEEDPIVSDFIVSMPLTEADEVIKAWLKKNDFQTLHYHQNKKLAVIETQYPEASWLIEMNAHTPLATRIHVSAQPMTSLHRLPFLRSYLDDYVNGVKPTDDLSHNVVPQAVRDLLEAVVCIYASRKERSFQLSGFCIDRNGLIATTAHDLIEGQAVRVVLSDGHDMQGLVVQLDAKRDLCLVRVSETLPAIIAFRDGRYAPGRNESLYALGCPRGSSAMIQIGALDGPPRRVDGFPLWQARMHIEPGSSGSPVIDGRGRLAAIVKGRYRGTDAVGFLIPFETILHFLGKY